MTQPRKIILVPYGRQKKGLSESGLLIQEWVKRNWTNSLSYADQDLLMSGRLDMPNEWRVKILIFWNTVYSTPSEASKPYGAAISIVPGTEWVKGLVLSGGAWHIESFPVDDDFSPNRLSVEYAPLPWWRRLFNFISL